MDDDLIVEVLEGMLAEGGTKRERCAEGVIERCVIDFATKFGVALPIGYVDFLRKSNGAVFEDAVFCYVRDVQSKDENLNQLYPASELFAVNERYRQQKLPKKYVILGFNDEGLFAFNTMGNFYALMNAKGYVVLKKFELFENLFQEAIEGAL